MGTLPHTSQYFGKIERNNISNQQMIYDGNRSGFNGTPKTYIDIPEHVNIILFGDTFSYLEKGLCGYN